MPVMFLVGLNTARKSRTTQERSHEVLEVGHEVDMRATSQNKTEIIFCQNFYRVVLSYLNLNITSLTERHVILDKVTVGAGRGSQASL